MDRRFRCDGVLCGRQIFAERFDTGVLAARGRRTERLDHIVQHLGLALGGRPAASLAARMMLPVSTDQRSTVEATSSHEGSSQQISCSPNCRRRAMPLAAKAGRSQRDKAGTHVVCSFQTIG